MSNQAPDPAPNFSKMALGMCLGAQVGNLSWKCAAIVKATKNQQFPIRPLALPQTFPKLPFTFLAGIKMGASVGNVFPLP